MVPSLTLALSGDVMLGRRVNPMIAEHGAAYPWGDLLPTLTGADCFLLNLECALTDHTERWHDGGHKPFYFRADPGVVETLRLAGVSAAALANNHAADFEMTGLLETVRVLDEAGIVHAGAGVNLAAAQAPALVMTGAWRIGTGDRTSGPGPLPPSVTSPGG